MFDKMGFPEVGYYYKVLSKATGFLFKIAK